MAAKAHHKLLRLPFNICKLEFYPCVKRASPEQDWVGGWCLSPVLLTPLFPAGPPLLLLWLQARFFSRKDLTIRNMQVRAKFNTSAQNKPEIFTMWYYSLIRPHAETARETRSSRFCMSDAGWGRPLGFHVGFDSFRHQWKSAVNTTEAITSSGSSCQWAASYPQEKQRSMKRGRNILRKSVGTSMWLKTDTSWYRTTKGFTERGVHFDVPEKLSLSTLQVDFSFSLSRMCLPG